MTADANAVRPMVIIAASLALLSACDPRHQPKSVPSSTTAQEVCNRYRIAQLANGDTVIQTLMIDGWSTDGEEYLPETLDGQKEFVRKYSCEGQKVVRVIAP